MKKILVLFTILISMFMVACVSGTTTNSTTAQQFVVTFDSAGGSSVESQTISLNGTVTEPNDPTKEGYQFLYWYSSDEETPYVFTSPVVENITLHASWDEVIDDAQVALDKINEDIAAIEDIFVVNYAQANFIISGPVNGSSISWRTNSPYVLSTGLVLTTPEDEVQTTASVVATFKLSGQIVSHTFTMPLTHHSEVVIAESKVVPFQNITTEYDVEDGNIELYFEDGGTVPYVSITDFLDLLQGFVDPEVEFTVNQTATTLRIEYQYYDEEEDHTYDLILDVDSTTNEISTNDPGFYWAYVYSTETNYGRHIEYDRDNPDASYTEGSEVVVYDLDNYKMDIVAYDDEILLPYYIVNQLFAGSSYYNVYYNFDGLFGIYALPSEGSEEYETIKSSTMNGKAIPGDLVLHTFDVLAFDMDYFYGLKDIMDVDTYYDYLNERIDEFYSTKASKLDYAIRDFLLLDIDEAHTSYGYPSYFNSLSWSGPEMNSLDYYGERFSDWYMDGMYSIDNAIAGKWGNDGSGWAAYSSTRPHYWFIDDAKTSVVIVLDDFNTSDIEESDVFDASLLNHPLDVEDASLLIPVISGGTKYFVYNSSSDEANAAEVLVKGLPSSYLDTYKQALINSGFALVKEETEDETKTQGYYLKTIGDTSYMVQVSYDDTLKMFYLGITDDIPSDYSDDWYLVANVEDTVYADSAVYMEIMMDLITEEAPNLENVMMDLTWNTGGNIGALYRVIGFVTADPFRVSGYDRDTGSQSSNYVMIGDGIPHYDNLNWSLLISPVTYSAANEMVTIFMENELGTIAGIASGGGACSITPILLPNGTAFTMSSNNINAFRTGSGDEADPYVYNNNEFGILPDVELSYALLYDNDVLMEIVNGTYSPE